MARFIVSFDADNAAFDDGYDGRAEVEAILRRIADRVFSTDDEGGLIRDSNGNTVGSWVYERNEDD